MSSLGQYTHTLSISAGCACARCGGYIPASWPCAIAFEVGEGSDPEAAAVWCAPCVGAYSAPYKQAADNIARVCAEEVMADA